MTVQRRSALLVISPTLPRIEKQFTWCALMHQSRADQRLENPDRAWGPVPEWTSKVRLDLESVNTGDGDENHRLCGLFRRVRPSASGRGWEAWRCAGPAR